MKLVVLLLVSLFLSSTFLQFTMADPTNVVVPSKITLFCLTPLVTPKIYIYIHIYIYWTNLSCDYCVLFLVKRHL